MTSDPGKKFRIFIITQDEPFFLAGSIDYFCARLPDCVEICGAYVLNQSPFGRRMSFAARAWSTLRIFGIPFFIFYSTNLLLSKLFNPSVAAVLSRFSEKVSTGSININSQKAIAEIRGCCPDVIVSLASNQIFKKELLAIPELCCLNVHTAQLPKYRGLMPVFWAMAMGEDKLGVSVFEMDEGVDTGPIVRQALLDIHDRSMHEMIRLSKYVGAEVLAESINDLISGKTDRLDNDDSVATRVGFPTREDVKRFKISGRKFF